MNTEYAFENGPAPVPGELSADSHQDTQTPADHAPLSEGENAKREERLQPELIDELAIEPPQTIQPSESKVFDKLSKTLADHAPKLKGNEKQREQHLRHQVASALANYTADQLNAGRLLSDYRTFYKSKRKWTEVAKELGKVINRSDRTIFRMIDEYKASLEPLEPEVEFDRTGIVGPELDEPEKRERNARLAIRVFLNNFPATEREIKLAGLLAAEAYQVWGEHEPFSMELRIKPQKSGLTIDGRKRPSSAKVQEKAA